MRIQMKSIFVVAAAVLLILSLEAPSAIAQAGDGDSISRLPNGNPGMAGFWGQVRRADVTKPRLPGYVDELRFSEWGLPQWVNFDRIDPEQWDYAGSCMPFGIS